MASAAKPRKKYKPAKHQTKVQLFSKSWGLLDLAFEAKARKDAENKELTIRTAFMGATLSFNSSWNEEEFCPSNVEAAKAILKNCDVENILVTWHFDWDVVLTVYCEDDYGKLYDQPINATFEMTPMCTPANQLEGPDKLIGVEDQIEGPLLAKAKGLCNPGHIKEWGYMATITYF